MSTSEHLREMFRLLDFDRLIICERVCISWNSFITSNPQLYWFKNPQKLYKSYTEQWRDSSLWLEIFRSLTYGSWYDSPIIRIVPNYEHMRMCDIREPESILESYYNFYV